MYLLSFWDFVDSLLKYLPLVFLILSAICFYKGYQATEDKTFAKVISSGGGVFGILLLLTAIGSFIWMQLEK